MRTVVMIAAPEVRNICPSSYIEGLWMNIPDEVEDIKIDTPPNVRPLKVRMTGKLQVNDDNTEAAEICIVSWDDFKVEE